MNWIPKALNTLILALAFSQAFAKNPETGNASSPITGAFSLINQHGDSVTESSYDGQYRLVFFGFTHCPDICPTTLSTVSRVLSDLGESASSIKPIFISVDYERDTPKQLNTYVSYFHPSFDGLTGTEDQIRAAADNFNTAFGKNETDEGGGWYHSSYLYLMDTDGAILDLFSHAVSAEILAEELLSITQNPKS